MVISKHDRGFKVILEGGLLLWAKCKVFHEIVDFFVLDMCSKPIFCSKIALKGKTCPRLLKPQKVAPNAKSCSKVAEHNRDRPNRDTTGMCLDTQWKTVYHSPVRVVSNTKICTMATCTKKWILITQKKQSERKKILVKTTIHSSSLCEPNFIPKNLTYLRSVMSNGFNAALLFTSERLCFSPQIIEYNEREG